MALEIERKFLVNQQRRQDIQKPEGRLYRQGYILNGPAKTVRIRAGGEKGYIAVKGGNVGLTRMEFEYEIPVEDAEQLLKEFCPAVISKRRYRMEYGDKIWEVDEFFGENEGLVVAKIELADEEEVFELPHWITEEVSCDERYYNANLVVFPYRRWSAKKNNMQTENIILTKIDKADLLSKIESAKINTIQWMLIFRIAQLSATIAFLMFFLTK